MRFLLLNIIPEDFLNPTSFQKMFFKSHNNECNFENIFNGFCREHFIPFSDGLYFPNKDFGSNQEVRIYNNGITELLINLTEYIKVNDADKEQLIVGKVLNDIIKFTKQHISCATTIHNSKRIFICISIIGCDGIISDSSFYSGYTGSITGSRILCMPIELLDVENYALTKEAYENITRTMCLACGIKM